jgi:hypothetical protein
MKRIIQFILLLTAFIAGGMTLHAQNPVAWWQAESNALDSVGTNNGTIQNAFEYVPGESGQAFSFVNGLVTIPNATNLNPANLTVQIWVKGIAPASPKYILSKNGGTAGASYAFYTGVNNGIAFWVNVPGQSGTLIISPDASPSLVWDGNWHQVTGVYDGTAVYLYVDGTEIGTTPYTGAAGNSGISYANASLLVFGNFTPTASYAWVGALDNVKIFDHALAASEVADTFTNSTSTFATNDLASWWQADGNALDSWGANNGTASGSVISFFQGKVGHGFLSTGTGASILVPDAPDLEPQNITVQAWVKSVSPGSFKYVLSKSRVAPWGSYALYSPTNGGMAFYVSVGPSGAGVLTISQPAAPAAVWDGAWHQITGTYDGAALHLYLDGLEVGSGTPAPGGIDYASTNTLNNGALVIANDPTLGYAMSGGIDEVKVWDQALTAQQVMDTYTSGKLISWWRAEGDATDSVGANNGTTSGNVSYGASRSTGTAFDLFGGVVEVQDSVTLQPANITVEASVSAVNPGTNKYLISKSFSPTGSSYAFSTGPNGGLEFYITSSNGTVSSPAVSPSAIWDGNFHFVAGTYDGHTVHIYVDGNEIGSGTTQAGSIQYGETQSVGQVLFGDFSSSGTSSNFVGLLDDIKIYNSALSLSNVQADAFQAAMITAEPQSIQAATGSTVALSVTALPPGAGYQWTCNGTNLSGASQPVLTLTNVQPAEAGSYQVTISVGAGDFVTNSLLGGEAFDLSGALVDVSQNASLEPASQITVQAWVRNTGSPGNYKYIITKALTSGVASYALYTSGSGGAAFYIYLAAGALVVSPVASASIWDGNWHQLTGVYDGEFVRLYVDGQQVGSGTDTLSGGAIDYAAQAANGDFIIGDYDSIPSARNYGGAIDEIKVFGYGMSDANVEDTYTNTTDATSTNELISWWQGQGNPLDSFGQNDGRILPCPGNVASSVAMLTVVNAAPAVFANTGISGPSFHATVNGSAGVMYAVQFTTSLEPAAWTPLVTNTAPFLFSDPIGAGNRFYRAVAQ